MGGIERHIADKTKPMVNLGFGIVTIIISHTSGSLGLSDRLEQKRVVSLFDP